MDEETVSQGNYVTDLPPLTMVLYPEKPRSIENAPVENAFNAPNLANVIA